MEEAVIKVLWPLLLTAATGGLTWWVKTVWNKIEDVEKAHTTHVHNVLENYVKRAEFKEEMHSVHLKLDKIYDKVENIVLTKADKKGGRSK